MTPVIRQLSAAEWSQISGAAHQAAFGELRPPASDRIDFCLLCIDEVTDVPVGYVTAREINAELLQFRFGGAFPNIRGTSKVLRAYRPAIDWTRGKYKSIITLIRNDNVPSLKVAMALGFRIVGVTTYRGDILVELQLDHVEA